MKIELRKLADIRPYEHNPRHNDDAVDAVAASLREFGFRQPIVVDAEGVIIVGHTRYKAALKLGLDKVPVHVAKDLTHPFGLVGGSKDARFITCGVSQRRCCFRSRSFAHRP